MPQVPVTIASVVLSGQYIRPDGTPLTGTLTFEPPAMLTFPDADVIGVGAATVELDETGAFSITLIATDAAGGDPSNWTYTVVERLHNANGRTFHIALPTTTPTVNLADIAPTDPAGGDYVVVTGPAGQDGTDGSQIYQGTGAPTSDIGVNGDYYIDITPGAVTWYGPKASGAWPAGVGLTGSGSAPVTSVAGKTGAVTLTASDVGADASGAASAAQTAAQSYTDTKVAAEATRADSAYAATTDTRLTNARVPTGSASGDLGGTYPSPTVTATHLSAPLPVAQGGTGAATATAALTALGGVATTSLGAASGVATLGTDGRLTTAQSPTRIVLKSSDTSVTSNATPAADPHLTMTVAASATYDVELIGVWTNGGGGLKAAWSGPSGATMVWTDNDGLGASTIGATSSFTGTSGTTFKGTLVVGSTAGSFSFLWSQSTSNAAATVLKSGCSLKLTRVA